MHTTGVVLLYKELDAKDETRFRCEWNNTSHHTKHTPRYGDMRQKNETSFHSEMKTLADTCFLISS